MEPQKKETHTLVKINNLEQRTDFIDKRTDELREELRQLRTDQIESDKRQEDLLREISSSLQTQHDNLRETVVEIQTFAKSITKILTVAGSIVSICSAIIVFI